MEESARIITPRQTLRASPEHPDFHFTSKVRKVPLPHHALHSAQIKVGIALIQWHLWCNCEEI